jgi:hypothetical protein
VSFCGDRHRLFCAPFIGFVKHAIHLPHMMILNYHSEGVNYMSNGHSSCGILGLFLGFLTGLVWLLLVTLDVITNLLTLLTLGALAPILNILIGLIGFLVVIIFGLLIFKKVWRLYFKK